MFICLFLCVTTALPLLFVVQLLSRVQLFWTPWTVADQAPPSSSISWSLLKLMSLESVMPSNHLILCRPHALLSSIIPSIRVFSNELALCIKWPKVLELQLQHQSFQWIFIVDFLSFRTEWSDLFVVQWTLRSPSLILTLFQMFLLC